jgi:ABC-type siderophore export system, fused ATPase and permease components
MTRLYEPSDGVLLWDGAAVANGNVEAYRSLFSVIFTDFHLFDRLYGIDDIDPARVHALLKDMQLADKIAFRNGRFSTTDLSTGQRKRLAMIVALLEGRPVCVFDEWAADQDPDFRRSYYEALLPRLKAEGRTVIAITHDDRYFHLADKLVWMEEGRIVRVDVPQRALADADDGPSLHP